MFDFHLLLEEQIPALIRYASALTHDREQADDLVEDTVIEAVRRSSELRRGGSLRLWLFTILHEHRANPFRRANPTATPVVADPDALLTLTDLDRALGQLSEEQRAVILLIGLEGLSYEQTAAVLRISVGTMRSRLTRGRDDLRRALGVSDETLQAQAA
jgi:RNA polymerase sigma-70 factor (ECF subfamily)